jgi:dihydroorotase
MSEVIVVRGGTVIDENGRRRADVVIEGDVIVAVGEGVEAPRGARVLDAGEAIVAPGLVDLHTHLREPGHEEAETVESGARAGALGGYTALVAMPNTTPSIDSAALVREVLALGRDSVVEVAVAGAITKGRRGEELAPLREMAELGVRLFTDDGRGVQDGDLMRRALAYANGLGLTLAQHCETENLSGGGVMHEGACSSHLGLPGIPAAAEEAMVARDIALVRASGGRLHFLHLSTAGSVELVRNARREGLAITAEVAPHHLALFDEAVSGFDPIFKVNPPLRTPADAAALREGLAEGVIDAIATDHAPHAPHTKERSFIDAPPGMLGLETALGIALTRSGLPIEGVLAALSWRPARIAQLHDRHGGPIEVGRPANLMVFDPNSTWSVDPLRLASKAKNTPYAGWSLPGRVRHTICAGEAVVVESEVQR